MLPLAAHLVATDGKQASAKLLLLAAHLVAADDKQALAKLCSYWLLTWWQQIISRAAQSSALIGGSPGGSR